MKKILFVCTGNTCRSSMAEAILKDLIAREGYDLKDFQISSAGITAIESQNASNHAITILKEKGIDISNHRAKKLTPEMVKEADVVLTMTLDHKRAVQTMVPEESDKVFALKEFVKDGKIVSGISKELQEAYLLLNEEREKFMEQHSREIALLYDKKERLLEELAKVEEKLKAKDKEFYNLTADIREKIHALEEELGNNDIIDPFGQPLEEYRRAEKEIREALEKLLDILKKEFLI